MIYEIDTDFLLPLIVVYAAGLLMGILAGWILRKGRESRKALTILENFERKSQKKDSGLALLEAIAEKGVPDNATLDIKFIKDWITAELNKK